MVKIKRGTLQDVAPVVELGEQFWEETDYHKQGIVLDKTYTTAIIQSLLQQGIVQVAYDEDDLVGFILLIVAQVPFAADRLAASEMAFYVDPEYRDKGVGRKLLRQAENVAKQLGVSLLSMVHLADTEGEKASEVYNKAGFSQSEVLYMKELN